jgi:hypothetical protein
MRKPYPPTTPTATTGQMKATMTAKTISSARRPGPWALSGCAALLFNESTIKTSRRLAIEETICQPDAPACARYRLQIVIG